MMPSIFSVVDFNDIDPHLLPSPPILREEAQIGLYGVQ